MANLVEQLRPSSFRGFEFDISEDSSAFGRRVSTHQFPAKDNPYHEDFGADVKKFNVQAVIHGADFIAKAMAFEDILNKEGPGTFVHPHYGEVQVVVLSAGRRHTHKAVGEVRFNISFEKDVPVNNPSSLGNTSAQLTIASDNAFNALRIDFIDNFISTQMPDFVLHDAITRISDITGGLNDALNQASVLHVFAGEFPVIKEISNIENVASDVIDLFVRVGNMFKPELAPAVSFSNPKTSSTGSPLQTVKALISSSDLNVSDDNITNTGSQAARVKNSVSLNVLNEFSSLSSAVVASKYVEYESREEAFEIRDEISSRLFRIRDIFGELGWDGSWRGAGELLNALSRDINERIGSLPKTVNVKPQAVQSSLRLAHSLYGDDPSSIFDNAQDLTKRNNIRHPGFMPADNLEVLVNEV